MNREQKLEQYRLVGAMGRLLRERAQHGIGDVELERRIEKASKAVYDFHASIIQPSKPKTTRKRSGTPE